MTTFEEHYAELFSQANSLSDKYIDLKRAALEFLEVLEYWYPQWNTYTESDFPMALIQKIDALRIVSGYTRPNS